MSWHLPLTLEPAACPRPRFNRRTGKTYYPTKYNRFKREGAIAIEAAMVGAGLGRALKGPLFVAVFIAPRRPKTTILQVPKPDVDNYCKAVLDAGNGLLWEDDQQVQSVLVEKAWAPQGEPGRVEIYVERIPDEWTNTPLP